MPITPRVEFMLLKKKKKGWITKKQYGWIIHVTRVTRVTVNLVVP